ncbi:MAG: hypothetical protein WC443_12405 [Desulfobaccales bacterium]
MVRFRFPAHLLEVDQLRDIWMNEDVMATPGALEREAKATD